jgi:hypothetical protein
VSHVAHKFIVHARATTMVGCHCQDLSTPIKSSLSSMIPHRCPLHFPELRSRPRLWVLSNHVCFSECFHLKRTHMLLRSSSSSIVSSVDTVVSNMQIHHLLTSKPHRAEIKDTQSLVNIISPKLRCTFEGNHNILAPTIPP